MAVTHITLESLETAGVEADELAALARQSRGAASGGHGYGYEDHFAVACLIAASVAWFERGEEWVVTLSHPYCWVDDVVIERPDAEQYAQLKTSPVETWGRDDGRLLRQLRIPPGAAMSRSYRSDVSERERSHLQDLLEAGAPSAYRSAMHRLGADLGRRLAPDLPTQGACLVVCTVEDADFLTRGMLESLGAEVPPERVVLHCFWNERRRVGEFEVAPIIRRYVEPGENVTALIVIKSIISGACVVRTNLMEVLEKYSPARIFVAAPVIHVDAESKLEREFPAETARRFSYVWLARDDLREEDGTVRPGIGGSVYDLLGLGGEAAKNRHYPQLIHERRAARRALVVHSR